MVELLSGLDARFLYSSTPTVHMHTVKVVVIDVSGRDGVLDDAGMTALIEASLDRMPVLRRRIVAAPRGLGNPAVFDDPDFDVHRHLRRRSLPAPGTQAQLDALIADIVAVPLPRDRPLWELTIVEGLAGDRLAFVMKLHHALADGMASVALLENAFVVDPEAASEAPFAPERPPTRKEHYALVAEGAARARRALPRVVAGTVRGLRDARRVRRTETATLTRPFAGPRTPFNVALTPDRTFATVTLPLDDLLACRTVAGVSLNDAFLTVCAGGVRRYLQRAGDLPGTSLTASVPVATRTDRRHLHGNHLDNLIVPLHTDEADPARRARAIRDSSRAARRVRAAFGPGLFELRAGLFPAALHGLMPRLWSRSGFADHVRPPLNLIVSNVRGPRAPMAYDGAVVTGLYSCGPILEGIGVNLTAWSYTDRLFVSVLGCAATLPDPHRLVDDLEAELTAWTEQVGSATEPT